MSGRSGGQADSASDALGASGRSGRTGSNGWVLPPGASGSTGDASAASAASAASGGAGGAAHAPPHAGPLRPAGQNHFALITVRNDLAAAHNPVVLDMNAPPGARVLSSRACKRTQVRDCRCNRCVERRLVAEHGEVHGHFYSPIQQLLPTEHSDGQQWLLGAMFLHQRAERHFSSFLARVLMHAAPEIQDMFRAILAAFIASEGDVAPCVNSIICHVGLQLSDVRWNMTDEQVTRFPERRRLSRDRSGHRPCLKPCTVARLTGSSRWEESGL